MRSPQSAPAIDCARVRDSYERPTRAARPGRPAAPAATNLDDLASMAWGVRNLISSQEPTDDEIEAELNTMLGAPAAAAALADVHVKQEA